ncbi:Transient receptor potential channel pyrexia [Orchesella cincta]|uniref:Transient receptor potential channel pyrexia n=1 Tax=Orchesella cincta TaxID=48709 RepID=A0A1D2NGH7_ORCCI|nr:Transient receptor potential channel pyrexia [Orchesella cincta]
MSLSHKINIIISLRRFLSNPTNMPPTISASSDDKKRPNVDTEISFSEAGGTKVEKLNCASEEIPLNSIMTSCEDEGAEKIRRIFVTGCSCVESMKKMWTQLLLLQDPAPRPVSIEEDQLDSKPNISRSHSLRHHHDGVDHVASTTELISATLKSRTAVPNKDVQKEASILRKHWSRLVQKIPGENTLLLCRVIEKKPLILDPFLEMLSGCIYFTPPSGKPDEGFTGETTITMELQDLMECPGGNPKEFREAQVLVHLVEGIDDMDVKDRILSHPVITTYATLKYQKFQFVSVMLLVYHLLFALLFTNYAFHTFLAEHPTYEVAVITKHSSVILSLMAFISAIKTATTFFASGFQFDLTTTRRIGEIFCAFVAFFMCLLPSFGYKFPFARESVNKDITAFGVMSSWLVLLSYLTKFNQTAVYVQTFFQIVKNYIQFLWMVAICQLIALSASYTLIFHKSESGVMLSGNLSRSFIRVLTGRMNYEDFTADKAELENPVTVFNYFILFFVLSTVMMGMIIGLATNGLQETRTASAVNVLCQVIKDIAELEWIISGLSRVLPRSLYQWLVKKLSIKDLFTSGYMLEIRPHDARDEKIPVSLKKSIYTHLIDRGATCHNRFSSQMHF